MILDPSFIGRVGLALLVSAVLAFLITPLVTFCCLAAGIVLYVLSRLVADAAALREDNDLTI